MNKFKILVISLMINFLLSALILYYLFFKVHITESSYTKLLNEYNDAGFAVDYSSQLFTSLLESEKILVILSKENIREESIIDNYKILTVPLLKPDYKKEMLNKTSNALESLYRIAYFNNKNCLTFAAKCAVVDNNINLAIAIVEQLKKINSTTTVFVNDYNITPDMLLKELIKFKNKKGSNRDMLKLCAAGYFGDFCSLKKQDISNAIIDLLKDVNLKKQKQKSLEVSK